MAISKRKEYDVRKRIKKTLVGLKKTWDAIITKIDNKETLRDEELRFLRTIPDTIEELEVKVSESLDKDVTLPEGRLRDYVEREWNLNKVCKDRETVIEATGYYRCNQCGEIHGKGRMCMFKEYQEMLTANQEETEDRLLEEQVTEDTNPEEGDVKDES